MYIHPNETILAEGANRLGNPVYLVHRPAGLYVAGSGMREDPESWGPAWEFDGCRHGQRHLTREEGEAHFNRITGKA